DLDRVGLPGREVDEGDVEAGWHQHLVAVSDQRRGPLTPSGHADHRIGRVTAGNLERKGIGSVGWIGIGRRRRGTQRAGTANTPSRPISMAAITAHRFIRLASSLGRRRMFRREGWPRGPPPDRSARRLAALYEGVSIRCASYFGLV